MDTDDYKTLIERTTREDIITPYWDCETLSYYVFISQDKIKFKSKDNTKNTMIIDLKEKE